MWVCTSNLYVYKQKLNAESKQNPSENGSSGIVFQYQLKKVFC